MQSGEAAHYEPGEPSQKKARVDSTAAKLEDEVTTDDYLIGADDIFEEKVKKYKEIVKDEGWRKVEDEVRRITHKFREFPPIESGPVLALWEAAELKPADFGAHVDASGKFSPADISIRKLRGFNYYVVRLLLKLKYKVGVHCFNTADNKVKIYLICAIHDPAFAEAFDVENTSERSGV